MTDEGMVENAARLGVEVFGPGLAKLAANHPSVGEVRGIGAFWAIELVANQETREPLSPYGASSPAMDATAAACRERGLLPFVNFNRMHVVPPLEHLRRGRPRRPGDHRRSALGCGLPRHRLRNFARRESE